MKLSEKLLNYFSLYPVKCWGEKGKCGPALCYDMRVLTISQITVSNNQSTFSIMFTNVGPTHVLLNRIRILHKPFTRYRFEYRPDWRWINGLIKGLNSPPPPSTSRLNSPPCSNPPPTARARACRISPLKGAPLSFAIGMALAHTATTARTVTMANCMMLLRSQCKYEYKRHIIVTHLLLVRLRHCYLQVIVLITIAQHIVMLIKIKLSLRVIRPNADANARVLAQITVYL